MLITNEYWCYVEFHLHKYYFQERFVIIPLWIQLKSDCTFYSIGGKSTNNTNKKKPNPIEINGIFRAVELVSILFCLSPLPIFQHLFLCSQVRWMGTLSRNVHFSSKHRKLLFGMYDIWNERIQRNIRQNSTNFRLHWKPAFTSLKKQFMMHSVVHNSFLCYKQS